MTTKATFLIAGLVCAAGGLAALSFGNETGAMAMLVASTIGLICYVLEP